MFDACNLVLAELRITTRQCLAVAKISVRSGFAYPGELASRTFFLGIILFIFLKLWQATYAQGGHKEIAGFSLPQMLWYLTFAEAMVISAPRLSHQVDEDVRSGSIAVRLMKPMNYPLYCLSSTLGERIVRFFFCLCLGGTISFLLVGPIGFAWQAVLMALTAILCAFLLDGLIHVLIGLAAFWLEDTTGIHLIYSRLTMILGGVLIPIELFPAWLEKIVLFLPFPYMIYGPVHLLLRQQEGEFLQLAMRQMLFLLLVGGTVALVYKRALGRIAAHGG
jgi:ABC-2 type transport system permease protein